VPEVRPDDAISRLAAKKLFEEQPDKRRWSEEAQWLVNPSIEARELWLPGIGTVEKLNTDYEYRWVAVGFGDRPRTERVQKFKAMGFDFASSDPHCEHKGCSCDVKVLVGEIVKDRNWIQLGDLVLMKCPAPLYRSYIKRNMLSAIAQTSRREILQKNGREIMSTANSIPGIQSSFLDQESIDSVRSRAVLDDNRAPLEDRVSSNAAIPSSSRRKS
jgi:hypothetical protein